jgi:hypothetical protein
LVLVIISAIGGVLMKTLDSTLLLFAYVIWHALKDAFSAILGVVIYHDLRVAKEGADTDQIAAVV